jgi:hypothetical protein
MVGVGDVKVDCRSGVAGWEIASEKGRDCIEEEEEGVASSDFKITREEGKEILEGDKTEVVEVSLKGKEYSSKITCLEMYILLV